MTRFLPSPGRLGAAMTIIAFSGACSPIVEPAPATGLERFAGSTGVPIVRFATEGATLAYNSGFTTPERRVIRDTAAWSSAWATLWAHNATAPALPAVDFTREMVLVAAMGQRSTGGHDILIDSVAATGSELLVRVRSRSPGAGCATTSALTEPVDIVRVPVRMQAVFFAEYSAVVRCQ